MDARFCSNFLSLRREYKMSSSVSFKQPNNYSGGGRSRGRGLVSLRNKTTIELSPSTVIGKMRIDSVTMAVFNRVQLPNAF